MRKYIYELGAGTVIVIGIIPVCIFAGIYSACLASYETFKIFPITVNDKFKRLYEEQ
jgi:hypothetical protein